MGLNLPQSAFSWLRLNPDSRLQVSIDRVTIVDSMLGTRHMIPVLPDGGSAGIASLLKHGFC